VSDEPESTQESAEADTRAVDRRDLADVLFLIRHTYPMAILATFQTSHTDTKGFELQDLEFPEGYPDLSEAELAKLAARVWDLLASISWDSIMDEDEGGSVTIDLREFNPLDP